MPRRRKGLLLLFHTILALCLIHNVRACYLHPLLTFWSGNQDPLPPNRQFLLLTIPPQHLSVRTHPINSSHVDLPLLLLLPAKVPKGRLLVPESSAGKRVNRSQYRLCPVAHCNLPLHSEQSHIPWFFNPDSVCWRCQKVLTTDAKIAAHSMPNHRPSFSGNHTLLWGQLFLGSLHFLASLLSLSSLWHLLTFVHEEHLFPSILRSILRGSRPH